MKDSVFMQMYKGHRSNEGSFTTGLYQLFMLADAGNKKSLLAAFPDMFNQADYDHFCGKQEPSSKPSIYDTLKNALNIIEYLSDADDGSDVAVDIKAILQDIDEGFVIVNNLK